MFFSRHKIFPLLLLMLLLGAGLFGASAALAQAVDLETFGQAAGFSTDLDIRIMIARLIRTAISFAGIVLVIMVIYGGFLWMTAAGSAERVEKAKKILINSAIGLLIVFSSFAIVSFVLGAITRSVGSSISVEGDGSNIYPDYPGGAGAAAFVLSSVNTDCAFALKNLELQFIFSRSVQESSVRQGGVRVREAGGSDVSGDFFVSGNRVSFRPSESCPENPAERCFRSLSDYQIILDPAILKSASGARLVCTSANPCQFSFRTGEGIDVSAPALSLIAPMPGQPLQSLGIELLQALAVDDTGAAMVEFRVDGELVFSAGLNNSTAQVLAPENYFQTDGTQWNTQGYLAGRNYSIQARGFDCSGRFADAFVSAPLRAANCFNQVQDSLLGETGVDCGGVSGSEFYCGACLGDECSQNGDCASGWCENGFCQGTTIIERVSPGDGAPGNLITVSGRGFGAEPGQVVFLGEPGEGDDVVVSAYDCRGAIQWSDSQVVLELAPQMKTGPLKIQTADLSEDYTNDARGPYIPDFVINSTVRPGLCALEPAFGVSGSAVRFLGINFGSSRGFSTAYFSTYPAASYAGDWSDQEFGAVVPLMNPGLYFSQVFVGDNFCSLDSERRCAANPDCPSGQTCILGREGSNRLNFQVLSAVTALAPIINYVDSGIADAPDSGPPGQYISIFGSNFGVTPGQVFFEKSDDTVKKALGSTAFPPVCENAVYWRDSVITVKVPVQYAPNDPVERPGNFNLYVRRGDAAAEPSNRVSFQILDGEPGPALCGLQPSAGPAGISLTALGENFGSSGATLWFTLNSRAPLGEQTSQTYQTQVPNDASTGPVYLKNDAGQDSNPVFFALGDCRSQNICAPSEQCCGDGSCRSECQAVQAQAFYLYRFFTGPVPLAPEVAQICNPSGLGIVSPTPWSGHTRAQDICINAQVSAHFRQGRENNAAMDQSTFHGNNIKVFECLNVSCTQTQLVSGQVTETTPSSFVWKPVETFQPNTSYAVTLNGFMPGADSSAIQAANGEYLPKDYSWSFTTANSDVLCSPGSLMVSPGIFTAKEQDQIVPYLARPVAAGDGGRCILLDCRQYQDQYSWASENDTLAPLLSQTQTACGISAQALGETRPEEFVRIQSSISEPAISGSGDLAIHFTDPEVVSYWPNCNSACVNAEIGARFNIFMDPASVNADTVRLYACKTQACLVDEDDRMRVSDFSLRDWNSAENAFQVLGFRPDQELLPNRYYLVRLSADLSSSSNRLLSARYGLSGFSWIFATKDDPVFCRVDRLELSPSQAKMSYIGQKQAFTAVPYGSPDDCSKNGQVLSAADYAWRSWSASDSPDLVPGVSVASLLADGAMALSAQMEPGCSANCLHTGSAVAAGTSICGNGIVEFGEDCDGTPGCSANCLHEGGEPPLCGNGILDSGEDCDDGNTVSGDGCSARCLAEGTPACVKECFSGLLRSGRNCTTQADCGNNQTCRFVVLPCCGNSDIEAGENCDDGNAASGDGCSARCLREGSSLNYGSVCGNGLPLETGEACEAAGSFRVGPYAVARVEAGAVEELLASPSDVYFVRSDIAAAVENSPTQTVSGQGALSLSCVCENDAQCGDSANFGCGTRRCCFPRPEIQASVPASGQTDVCRNSALYFEFDQLMDLASVRAADGVSWNLFLKLVNSDGTDVDQAACQAAGHAFVASAQDLPWYARAWNRIKDSVMSFFGRQASAELYRGCLVSGLNYSSEALDSGVLGPKSRLRLNLPSLLNADSFYLLLAVGDADKDDALPQGLLSKYSVGLKAGASVLFTTGSEICSLDKVIVEDLGREPFDELNPSYGLFTKNEETHRLQAAGYSFRQGQNQEIQPIAGIYEWGWSWNSAFVDDSASCPVDDPSTPEINENSACLESAAQNSINVLDPSAPEINPAQALAQAQNQDGVESVYALAQIIEGGESAKEVAGQQPLTVLLCANPWPDANFPYVQSDSQGSKGPTNFGFYYCRDAGDPDKTEDDLPALKIQEVATPAAGGIYREFLYILEGQGEALGVRVMNNPGYLPPDMWYRQAGFTGSPAPETLDGYEAVREGNTIYASAANQTGDIYPNIYVISATNQPSAEAQAIFDQILKNWRFNTNTEAVTSHNLCVDSVNKFMKSEQGNFLPCRWDGDCPSPGACSAAKAKLTRDLKRLSDLVRVKSYITGACSSSSLRCSGNEDCPAGETCQNLFAPALSQGSFIRAMSVSRWPSWNAVLGNALGRALPQDPLNVFYSCPGEPYDPESCFNATDGVFQCATGSHIYGFTSSTAGAYTLTAQLEHGQAPWAFPLDPVLGDSAEIVAEYVNYTGPSVTVFNQGLSQAYEDFSAAVADFSGLLAGVYYGQPNLSDWRETSVIYGNSFSLNFTASESVKRQTVSLGNRLAGPTPHDQAQINGIMDKIELRLADIQGIYAYPEIAPLRVSLARVRSAFNMPPVSDYFLKNGFRAPSLFCSGATMGDSSICGDGIKAPDEICELGEVQTQSCAGGFVSANCIGDNGACRFQTALEALAAGQACVQSVCGNGVIDSGEACDDGALNGTYGHCGRDCQAVSDFYCGDGYLGGGEQCDCGTVSNFSSLPADSWAKSANNCQAANGQYVADITQSCSFDCRRPGPSCGDGLINGPEQCDGGSERQSCGFDSDGREKFQTRYCTNACSWPAWSSVQCVVGSSCGDGEVNPGEECDDGNTNNNDACRNDCKLNVCGDGVIYAGVEACDFGARNGQVCNAPYNSTCYYCTADCRYQALTGPFCGDGIINGPEFCDGAAFANSNLGYCNGGERNGQECDNQSQLVCTQFNQDGSCQVYQLQQRTCPNGICVPPKCSSACDASCPVSFQKTSVLIRSGEPGATPQESLSLYSFLNPENNFPDRADLLLPACRVGTGLTANVNRARIEPPNIDIVFVIDRSLSMNNWLASVKAATSQAIGELLESYRFYQDKQLRIALVGFDGCGAEVISDFFTDKTALINFVNGNDYTVNSNCIFIAESANLAPVRTDLGLQKALNLLSAPALSSVKNIFLVTATPQPYPDNDTLVMPEDVADVVRFVQQPNSSVPESQVGLERYANTIKIFTLPLTPNIQDRLSGLMQHVSSNSCPVEDYNCSLWGNGTICLNTNLTRANSCQPSGATNYALFASQPSQVQDAYSRFTQTVKTLSMGLVFSGVVTAGSLGEGVNQTLPFPSNFACTGAPQSLPLRLDFLGQGRVDLSNFRFEYCPSP